MHYQSVPVAAAALVDAVDGCASATEVPEVDVAGDETVTVGYWLATLAAGCALDIERSWPR